MTRQSWRIVDLDISFRSTSAVLAAVDAVFAQAEASDGVALDGVPIRHRSFRDGHADWPYLEKFTDAPREFAEHLKTRTPEWASRICDVPVADIEAFAKLIGETKRTFFRIGYGFTRSRNGAPNIHP